MYTCLHGCTPNELDGGGAPRELKNVRILNAVLWFIAIYTCLHGCTPNELDGGGAPRVYKIIKISMLSYDSYIKNKHTPFHFEYIGGRHQ
jgi:hypothetical protein